MIVKRFAVAVVLAVALIVGAPVAAMASATSDGMVALVNNTRASAGLSSVVQSAEINAVAQRWAEYMASGVASDGYKSDLYAHNPNYAAQIPPGWRGAAENIAWQSAGYPGGYAAMHDAWVKSAPHYANLTGNYTHVGVGWTVGSNGTMYGVQVFALYPAPAPAPAKPPSVPVPEPVKPPSVSVPEPVKPPPVIPPTPIEPSPEPVKPPPASTTPTPSASAPPTPTVSVTPTPTASVTPTATPAPTASVTPVLAIAAGGIIVLAGAAGALYWWRHRP